MTPVRFSLLGVHRPRVGSTPGAELFDGFDAVVELSDGDQRVVGVRTAGLLDEPEPVPWDNGYVPLEVTLDLRSVRYFDFNSILWLGPDPWPCLIWSNAEGLRLDAVRHLLSPREGATWLDGPHGRGLPRPGDLGVRLSPGARWYPISAPASANGVRA